MSGIIREERIGPHRLILGDCLEILRGLNDQSVQSCITSPPYYWQRDYGVDGQIGHEETPEAFVAALVAVFAEVRRVLHDRGTLWLNLGDSYYNGNGQPKGSDPRSPSRNWIRRTVRPLDVAGLGYPKKSLLGMPWRVALALQADGWTLRQEIIWCRETAFPEPSVKDRPHRQHETVFLLSKSRRYDFDRSALTEESVWHISHERSRLSHSAPFPVALAERCLLASTKSGDVTLDPFGGSGTVGVAAARHGRKAVLCELNSQYVDHSAARINAASDLFVTPPEPAKQEAMDV